MTFDEVIDLLAERKRLQKRLEWLGVRSTGSERLERRIREIENRIASQAITERLKHG